LFLTFIKIKIQETMSEPANAKKLANDFSDSHQGSFVNGFTVGLFAGALGYFLFGTNKGSKIRSTLVQEWESAQKEIELVSDKSLKSSSNNPVSIREVLGDIINSVVPKVIGEPNLAGPKAKNTTQVKALNSSTKSLSSGKTSKKRRNLFRNIS
jgi:hypothetical protein